MVFLSGVDGSISQSVSIFDGTMVPSYFDYFAHDADGCGLPFNEFWFG
jgi:hypothetical protein